MEEEEEPASLITAVKKGPSVCIAELTKLVFKGHATDAAAARQRLAMVRYATRTGG